jgi:hypothetical protein
VALVLNEAQADSAGSRRRLPAPPARVTWPELRELVGRQSPLLSAPRPGLAGLCAVCRGPAARRGARCYQCELHRQCAHDGLADLVLPVAFAIKGGLLARRLWQYKSIRPHQARPDVAANAAVHLNALLLVFLHDHGGCLWREAGLAGPTHVAVVPTARGRAGEHPLRRLVAPYLARPWAELSARPGGQQVRDLDPERFGAAPLPGARVLLLDDTWTTGASAQSAAMALRRAGAESVCTVVIGRHVDQAAAELSGLGPATMPFSSQSCAVHHDRTAGG